MARDIEFIVAMTDRNGNPQEITVAMDPDEMGQRHHSFKGRLDLAPAIAWKARMEIAKTQPGVASLNAGRIRVESIRQVPRASRPVRFDVVLREGEANERTVQVKALTETEAQFSGAWKVAADELGPEIGPDLDVLLSSMSALFPSAVAAAPVGEADMQTMLVELYQAVESGDGLDEVKERVRETLDDMGLLEGPRAAGM